MDFWPARAQHEPVEHKHHLKGQTTTNYGYNSSTIGPVLSPGNGTLTAAVLRSYQSTHEITRKRLEWDFITREGENLFTLIAVGVLKAI